MTHSPGFGEQVIMMIHEITPTVGRYKARKRIGRGHGSGHGKTSGRGHKGAGSRSGYKRRPHFEGGQMSFVRRIPKRGFSNFQFQTNYHVINLKSLEERLDDGAEVNVAMLVEAGLIRDTKLPLKVLGEGELTKKFTVTAAKFSATARTKIEASGGTVVVNEKKKWRRTPKSAKPKAAAKGTETS